MAGRDNKSGRSNFKKLQFKKRHIYLCCDFKKLVLKLIDIYSSKIRQEADITGLCLGCQGHFYE